MHAGFAGLRRCIDLLRLSCTLLEERLADSSLRCVSSSPKGRTRFVNFTQRQGTSARTLAGSAYLDGRWSKYPRQRRRQLLVRTTTMPFSQGRTQTTTLSIRLREGDDTVSDYALR